MLTRKLSAFWVAAPPRPTPIPVLVGSYGSERTQPSFPRWRRGPRGLYTDEEQSYISAAYNSQGGVHALSATSKWSRRAQLPTPRSRTRRESRCIKGAIAISRSEAKVDEVGTALSAAIASRESNPEVKEQLGELASLSRVGT